MSAAYLDVLAHKHVQMESVPKRGEDMLSAGNIFYWMASHVRARLVPYTLVVTSLIVGFVIGGTATSSVDADTRRQIQEVLQQFFLTAPGTIVPSGELVARQALGGELMRSGLLMWVLGLTVIGAPLVLVISLMRGFALGFTTTFIIEELGWRGGVISAAALLPHNLFAIPGLLMAGAAGLMFAGGAARILFGRPTAQTVYGHFASSMGIALVAAVLLTIGVLVEAYITPVFVNLAVTYIL